MPHDHYTDLTRAGDFLSLALPVAGILSYADGEKMSELLLPALKVGVVCHATAEAKRFFRHTALGTRPNGYHSSFPSAHSSFAFIGARLIHKKFGPSYGALAYSFATLTAISRVEGQYHHTRDVLVGAALAIGLDMVCDKLSSHLSNRHTRWHLSPNQHVGLCFEISFRGF